MSTSCMTVHDLRILLGAPEEQHTCHEHSPCTEMFEEKTADHWSAQHQLEPPQLDLQHDKILSLETAGGKLA